MHCTQRWGFPSKQNPAHKNPALIARVKELWEKNYMQRDMVDTLLAEGFQINDRELMRLRLRFKWFLRESASRGGKNKEKHEKGPKRKLKKRKGGPGNGRIGQLADAIRQEDGWSEEEESDHDREEEQDLQGQLESAEASAPAEHETHALDPAETLRRQLRQEQLQVESDEKWRTRKRRRRTRGWAGLPADAPGQPPRFPSETTLDESKAYLSLDNKLYKEVREQFQAICEQQGVIKKTVAGPEKWAQLLQGLIRENAHLSSVFRQESEVLEQNDAMWRPKNHKALSLDVICQDVTKRMRTMESRLGIPEAKNALGLNPEQTREVRAAFMAILKVNHFTNKFEAGDQHWNELKQRWVQGSELLRGVFAGGQADPKHAEKWRAVEVLARDVMKRLRAENCQKDPSRKQAHRGPGPGPAPPTVIPHASNTHLRSRSRSANRSSAQVSNSIPVISASPDLQIDPSLLLAASDASILTPASHEPSYNQHSHQHQHHAFPPQNPYTSISQQNLPSVTLPIYFRLHPHSTTPFPNKTVWLSVLQSGTISEVRGLAMREHPGTMVLKLEGLVVHRGSGAEREVSVAIDDDGELSAFLEHVGAAGKATFVVLLGM